MKKRIFALFLVFALMCAQIPTLILANNNDAAKTQPLAGKYISVIGDSISTYTGYSDSKPITSEDCTYRYGEAYYGPEGSDCHNTDLLVEDTWWYQSAEDLGAKILVSNAGNSTGLLTASYPADLNWQQYLEDMLAYKSRPYYLGVGEKTPDIIALYIGSNDVAKVSASKFGNIEDVDFDTLIIENEDGTYTYATPTTVVEAYCIMMHKIKVTYPNAEIYCFTVVPNSSGKLTTCNTRLNTTYLFNDMIKSVANHYGAIVTDILEEFALDPDKDKVATQEDFDTFKTYFNGDPHPNASGFDVISNCFTRTILENSRYVAEVETRPGKNEYVGLDVKKEGKKLKKSADGYITESNMYVDYKGTSIVEGNNKGSYSESYSVIDEKETYMAEGGKEKTIYEKAPIVNADIPLFDEENKNTTILGNEVGIISQIGDFKNGEMDGTYDYEITERIGQGCINIDVHSAVIQEHRTAYDHEQMTYLQSDTVPTEDNDMIVNVTPVEKPETKEDVLPIGDTYEYVYIGSDQMSNYWASYVYDSADEEALANEEPIYEDEEYSFYVRMNHNVFIRRGLVAPNLFLTNKVVSGTFPAWYDSVQQFMLADRNAQIITTYCADQKTPAVEGYNYRMVNVFDSKYYSEEEAKKISVIAKNGYWGTESGFGSLEELKIALRNTNLFTEEELASITDGMAMTAMQYAIWTFSNVMDEITFINAYYTNKPSAPSKAADQETVKTIFKIYNYLVNLTPEEVEKTTQNTLINEDNFLNTMSFEIKDKPDNYEVNKDEDTTNDIYRGDLSFSLKIRARSNTGDDLTVKVLEGDKVIASGQISGEVEEGQSLMMPNENGEYIFENVDLQEGTQTVRFILEGTQNMEKGAYLFVSEVKDDVPSQTMVGVAEGPRKVNVSMDVNFSLDVEDETISVEHVWRKDRPIPPETGDTTNLCLWMSLLVLSGAFLMKRLIEE